MNSLYTKLLLISFFITLCIPTYNYGMNRMTSARNTTVKSSFIDGKFNISAPECMIKKDRDITNPIHSSLTLIISYLNENRFNLHDVDTVIVRGNCNNKLLFIQYIQEVFENPNLSVHFIDSEYESYTCFKITVQMILDISSLLDA